MKKFLLSTAVLSALVIGGCATATENAKESVATYKGGEITQAELYDRMKEANGNETLKQMMIEEILTVKYGDKVTDEKVQTTFEGEKSMYGSEDEFAQALAASGFTEKTYKDIIRYSLLMETAVRENTEVTDAEIKVAYEEFEAPITAAHILVSDEALAKDLTAQLEKGADFSKLAEENSEDTGSATEGGEVTFSKGEMVPEFEEAAFAMKEGEMSKEPVKSDYGFHIIKTIKKAEKGTLEKEKDFLKESVLAEKVVDEAYSTSVLSELFKEYDIKITDKDLESAMDIYLVKETSETPEGAESGAVESSESSSVDSSKE